MEEFVTKTLEELLQILEEQKQLHPEIGSKMMSAYNSSLYALDFLGISALKRSMSLIGGFVTMIREENFVCAAPLVRLQLDNSLRFYAAFLVNDPHELAKGFMDGKSIRSFKEMGTNQKLTDRLILERLAVYHPWIIKVYEETSGYVHLSEKHLYNTLGKKENASKLQFVAGEKDSFITEKLRFEAAYIMIRLTTVLLWVLNSWTLTKETPKPEDWIKKHDYHPIA
jgi:hypothetical protein